MGFPSVLKRSQSYVRGLQTLMAVEALHNAQFVESGNKVNLDHALIAFQDQSYPAVRVVTIESVI